MNEHNCDYCGAPDAGEVVWTSDESLHTMHLCEACDLEEIKSLESGEGADD